MDPFLDIHTELIKECFFPLSFFKILRASSLLSGFDINSPVRSMTLSAPKTKLSIYFLLILLAFNSAKFFEIISGVAFSLIKLSFTTSSYFIICKFKFR